MNRKLCYLILMWTVLASKPVFAQEEQELPDWISVSVNLPESYENSKRVYPVIYLLSASPFYIGEYHQETTELIRELHRYGNFPEVITVNLKVSSLYDYVANQPLLLSDVLNTQLVPQINRQYRTGISSTLVGFSYSAGFTAIYAPALASQFGQIISISPVFPDAKYALAMNAPKSLGQASLYLAYGNESLRELTNIKDYFADGQLKLDVLTQENHQSVLLPALRRGLYWYFGDYRTPGFNQTVDTLWDSSKVRTFLSARNQKYQLPEDEAEFSELCTSLAQDYMAQHKLDVAYELWQHSQSRFRSYFLHQYALGQIQAGNPQRASKVYSQMAKLSPLYPLPDYQKLKQAEGLQALSEKKLLPVSQKIQMMTTEVSEQEINDFAYLLIQDSHHRLAINTLLKGMSLYPESANLLDSLADAYIVVNDKQSAKDAITKALDLADNDRQKQHLISRLEDLSESEPDTDTDAE